MGNVHNGHRERMRDRFLKEGLENFAEHEVLEVVLYNVITRGNTNPLGHNLIDKFGSFANVCDASVNELTSVEGIGEGCAIQIKMIPELCRYYMLSKKEGEPCVPLINSNLVRSFLFPYFVGKTTETLFLLCLDNQTKPIECFLISEGAVNATHLDMRKITECVIKSSASAAILAHNHPKGFAFPSPDDLNATNKVQAHLKNIDVALLDHFIFSDSDAVSLVDSGYMQANA